MKTLRKKLHGFTLMEILVVVTIIIVLAVAIIMAYQNQIGKANDARRKEDLRKFKIAFEDYYNDTGCYPTEAFWESCTCDSACFVPYMEKFLCDPVSKTKYYYKNVTDEDGNPAPCKGYLLYAKLANSGDADIDRVGCDFTLGCGYNWPLSGYNYGISVGARLTAEDFVPNPTALPTQSPTSVVQGDNFCLGGETDGSGTCNKKSGCTRDGTPCVQFLLDSGCQGFTDFQLCNDLCATQYETYKCSATEVSCLARWCPTP